MPRRWTTVEVSEALLYGLQQGNGWEWAPILSGNFLPAVDPDGTLHLTLASGQQFKMMCEEVPR